ncbi:MAG: ATP12 family protein [Pseudomonadota bacterium]
MSGPFDIFGLGADPDRPEESPARKAQINSARPLPKRFFDQVGVRQSEDPPGYEITLDDRPVRTPARRAVVLKSIETAEALAVEWRAQETVIDPKDMPLTRLVNSALDGVETQKEAVRSEIAKFAATDLLCYRAETPERLVERQNAAWDPVLAYFDDRYGCRFHLAGGIIPVEQPVQSLETVRTLVERFDDPLQLAALHSMTTLLGSCLLTLALSDDVVSPDEAWAAAHLDEDWNIEQWGADEEASRRRAYRHRDFKAALIALDRDGA